MVSLALALDGEQQCSSREAKSNDEKRQQNSNARVMAVDVVVAGRSGEKR